MRRVVFNCVEAGVVIKFWLADFRASYGKRNETHRLLGRVNRDVQNISSVIQRGYRSAYIRVGLALSDYKAQQGKQGGCSRCDSRTNDGYLTNRMVNPFRKRLVTGIPNLSRLGLTASMNRHGTFMPAAANMVEHQAHVNTLYVAVSRIFKRLISQIGGFVKEGDPRCVGQQVESQRGYGFRLNFLHNSTVSVERVS